MPVDGEVESGGRVYVNGLAMTSVPVTYIRFPPNSYYDDEDMIKILIVDDEIAQGFLAYLQGGDLQ